MSYAKSRPATCWSWLFLPLSNYSTFFPPAYISKLFLKYSARYIPPQSNKKGSVIPRCVYFKDKSKLYILHDHTNKC